jgi:hypothetical protein
MQDVEVWLIEAAAKWGAVANAEQLSDYQLAKRVGCTRHQARKILMVIARGCAPTPTPTTDAPEEAVEREHTDWLWTKDYVYNASDDTYITFTKTSGSPIAMSGVKHRAILQAYSNWAGKPDTLNMICRKFAIPRPWLVEYLRIHNVTHDSEPFSREEVDARPVEEMVEEAHQRKRQALYQQFEQKKWKATQADADKWVAFEATVLERLELALGGMTATPVPTLTLRPADSPYAAVVTWTDFHWGMYSWAGDVGVSEVYSRDIAEERLMRHLESIVSRFDGRPEKIIIAVGSDFFHIDGQKHETTRGTSMDTDGTPTEIFVTGCELNVRCIDFLRQVAPVEVHLMSGNHDSHNGRALLLYLMAWYRTTDNVTVHKDFRKRVYTQYGNTLVGFTHGDQGKIKDLGVQMAIEARAAWSETDHHVFFGGHLHHHAVQDIGGVTHHLLPSLSGTDRWHHEEGYVCSKPALLAYIIDEEDGIVSWVQSTEK